MISQFPSSWGESFSSVSPRYDADTHRGDEVGGGGGHSGAGGGARAAESFGQERPHHSVTGEQQTSTQQSERDVQLAQKRDNFNSLSILPYCT